MSAQLRDMRRLAERVGHDAFESERRGEYEYAAIRWAEAARLHADAASMFAEEASRRAACAVALAAVAVGVAVGAAVFG